jgi:hypothetical protein
VKAAEAKNENNKEQFTAALKIEIAGAGGAAEDRE